MRFLNDPCCIFFLQIILSHACSFGSRSSTNPKQSLDVKRSRVPPTHASARNGSTIDCQADYPGFNTVANHTASTKIFLICLLLLPIRCEPCCQDDKYLSIIFLLRPSFSVTTAPSSIISALARPELYSRCQAFDERGARWARIPVPARLHSVSSSERHSRSDRRD